MEASDAASQARIDMIHAFGDKMLKPGQYVWRDVPDAAGPERFVISLSDQMAYLYRGDTLVAATTISSGRADKATPDGIFSVQRKAAMYRSKKYDNAADAVRAVLRSGRPGAARGYTSAIFQIVMAASTCRPPLQEALFDHRCRDADLHRRLTSPPP